MDRINKKNLTINETLALAFDNNKKNNLKAAETLYTKILNADPNHFESNFFLGSLLAQSRQFDKARGFLAKAIQIKPEHADAHNNLGSVFKELGKIQEAKTCFEKSIQINPEAADIHYNLGVTLGSLGKHMEAIACYKKAILKNPEHTVSLINLSELLKTVELKMTNGTNNNHLKDLFLMLFRRNDFRHRDIFFKTITLLKSEKNFHKILEEIDLDSISFKNEIIKNFLKEELFLLMLQKTLIADSFLEKILTKIRSDALFLFMDSNKNIFEENIKFITSLAEQCFLNEYVYAQTKKEANFINQLKNKIEKNTQINEMEIIILGCYIPLYSSPGIATKLLNYKSKNTLFNDLINMQIIEPLKEQKLVNSIKSLGKISNAISKKVRDQYEQHPYPRWRYTYANMRNNFLFFLNNQIKPNKILVKNKFNSPNVLVAGCGTGNHLCFVENYSNANILAIDLSLASLAYSKRKAEELNFKNIEFLHADILQLGNLNRKFDVIECVGVLHHMEDPVMGLKILLNLLEPHGFLKIGLYSKKARQNVIKAKKFIQKNKFKNTINDIKISRQAIIKKNKNLEFKNIVDASDFYSTSVVKDLLFHAQEHQFTLPQISKILKNLNLEFLGFDNLKIKNKYSKLFPDDKSNTSLDSWNKFETSNPYSFSGMYSFWVRKIK